MGLIMNFVDVREFVGFLKGNLDKNDEVLIYVAGFKEFEVFVRKEDEIYRKSYAAVIVNDLGVESLEEYVKEEFKDFKNVLLAF